MILDSSCLGRGHSKVGRQFKSPQNNRASWNFYLKKSNVGILVFSLGKLGFCRESFLNLSGFVLLCVEVWGVTLQAPGSPGVPSIIISLPLHPACTSLVQFLQVTNCWSPVVTWMLTGQRRAKALNRFASSPLLPGGASSPPSTTFPFSEVSQADGYLSVAWPLLVLRLPHCCVTYLPKIWRHFRSHFHSFSLGRFPWGR